MIGYDDNMSIVYDRVSMSTLVDFHGELHYLIGPFLSREDGIAAGEEKCRCLGWKKPMADGVHTGRSLSGLA